MDDVEDGAALAVKGALAMAEPTKVNVLVAADWDAGISLTPGAPPLADVPPLGRYETLFVPQMPVLLNQIAVSNVFRLDEVEIGDTRHLFELLDDNIWDEDIDSYKLERDPLVLPGQEVRLWFVNITDKPQKPRSVTLVKAP